VRAKAVYVAPERHDQKQPGPTQPPPQPAAENAKIQTDAAQILAAAAARANSTTCSFRQRPPTPSDRVNHNHAPLPLEDQPIGVALPWRFQAEWCFGDSQLAQCRA
jgi:hypothetical protein